MHSRRQTAPREAATNPSSLQLLSSSVVRGPWYPTGTTIEIPNPILSADEVVVPRVQ